jgi:7-cyano-7-deazaguanine synthase
VVSFKKALDEGEILLALTFDYHQRSAAKEIESAQKICKRYRVPHRTIELPWLAEIGKGALVNSKEELPQVQLEELNHLKITQETAKKVWISNRNGVLIEIAAAFAESLHANCVVTGFNAEEAATFPDNTEEYCKAITQALRYSTSNQVQALSYTQHLMKKQIVELGVQIQAPLDLIWSCYEGREKMCGICESCQRAKRAFLQAGHLHSIQNYFQTL